MSTLLIVDDEITSRIRLAQLAMSLGYTTILASDGQRALAVLEDNPNVACVVTDCQMPNMDGPAMIVAIRAGGNKIPILVYSAYCRVTEVAALLDHGANGFLGYPVNRESLAEYLERYLSKN